ncbi:MAG: HAMP domain-containing protein, partial [Oscillochloris sp.]|nr:HAMP domain-containing protein [Oscillochloris sp.]
LAAEPKAIGDGQLDLPIDTTGIDEIGQLQRALQQMAMDLRDREQVLLERTTQLIEHQRLKLELTRQRDVADAASQAKSAFLAVMSHELRTPLTAIMGYSQLLEHMIAIGDYSTAASDLRRISGAGQHLLSLVNDVLDLAQIEAGRLRISAERVDVPTLINSVTETVEPLVTQKQNTLRVTCPAQMPPLFTDPLKLRQALLNLLSNAAKFTNAGQIDLRVSEEQIDGHPWIAFVVADTGIGIPRNQMDKLFKPFSQVNDRAARRYGGTGLGLSLSRRLCQLLGGDISVESFFGVGSVFTIRLPVSAPTNPPAAITARPSITSAATPSS